MSNNKNIKFIEIHGSHNKLNKTNSNAIDKSNNVTVYKKIEYPTRQSKEEREKLQKITQRPALMDNVGNL